jgi:hypothetical protein
MLFVDPGGRGETVVEASREGMFGRESIIDETNARPDSRASLRTRKSRLSILPVIHPPPWKYTTVGAGSALGR